MHLKLINSIYPLSPQLVNCFRERRNQRPLSTCTVTPVRARPEPNIVILQAKMVQKEREKRNQIMRIDIISAPELDNWGSSSWRGTTATARITLCHRTNLPLSLPLFILHCLSSCILVLSHLPFAVTRNSWRRRGEKRRQRKPYEYRQQENIVCRGRGEAIANWARMEDTLLTFALALQVKVEVKKIICSIRLCSGLCTQSAFVLRYDGSK